MEIRTLPFAEIDLAVYNPRKSLTPDDPEYRKLKKSLDEFGLVEPLVYNRRTGRLVSGHQRLKILKDQGVESAEFSVVDLPEKKEKVLNLALNKIAGRWDFPKLREILTELDTGEMDMELMGFDEKELEKIQTFESDDLHYEERVLRPYRMTHVLLSFPPDRFALVQPLLEQIVAIDGVEYEQGSNG